MIHKINELYEKSTGLLDTVPPSLNDLQNAANEITELVQSQELKKGVQEGSIPISLVGKLSQLEDDIKNKIDEIKSQSQTLMHNSKSEKVMRDADDLYWKGKWKEAANLYSDVIKNEPSWVRAKEYLEKAERNYITGEGIPSAAIPDSVKFPVARAESALSRWDLDRAKEHLDIALSEAAINDISAWGELNDLRYRVENSIDIHNSYQAAILIPNINEAVEKIELAYQQSNRPLYKQKLDELKMEQDKLQTLQVKFRHGLQLIGEGKFTQAIELLTDVVSQYPKNQEFIDGLNRARKASDQQKEYENCVQNARLEMSLAHFQQALDWLNRAKELNAVSMSKLKDLIEVSQTALEIQSKYYELMGRGRQYMDSEDFQSAMEVFREAGDLTQNPLPTEKLLLAEEAL